MLKEVFNQTKAIDNIMSYNAAKKRSIKDNIEARIESVGMVKPAYVALRNGGTIARITFYKNHEKQQFFGSVVLLDNHNDSNKPSLYVYAKNRLLRLDCAIQQDHSFRVKIITLVMDYCVFNNGDKEIRNYVESNKVNNK